MKRLFHLFRLSGLFILLAASALAWAAVSMTPTARAAGATTPPPGTVVHAASCEQAPPQSVRDRVTYTPAELARYGLPPRTPGEPFEKWAKVVRAAGQRVCDYTVSSDSWWVLVKSEGWAGWVADESTPSQNYTEADMDYFVPCINTATTPPTHETAVMAAWIGLGGNLGVDPLVQTGTAAFQYWDNVHGWHTQYRTFVENTGGTDSDAHYFFDVSCNTHIYVEVWGGDCMYLLDLNNGVNTGNQCYGPSASNQSAEAIIERNYTNLADYPYFAHYLPDRTPAHVTFHGVGITDNGSYKAMSDVPHNMDQSYYCRVRDPSNACNLFADDPYATVGGILYEANNVPYDMYAVTWQHY